MTINIQWKKFLIPKLSSGSSFSFYFWRIYSSTWVIQPCIDRSFTGFTNNTMNTVTRSVSPRNMHTQFNTFSETHFQLLLDIKFWVTFIRFIQLQFGFSLLSELFKHVMDIPGMNGVGHSRNFCLSVLDLLIIISIIRIMLAILGPFSSSGTVSLAQMLSM